MKTPSLQYTKGGESELDDVTRRVITRLRVDTNSNMLLSYFKRYFSY